MKTDKIKVYVLEFTLLAIVSFALFVPNIFNRIILAGLILIGAIVTILLIKKRKTVSIHTKKVIVVMVILAVIYLIAFYLMGLYFGYNKINNSFSISTIIEYIIPIAVIIISTELIRNILIVQNTKYTTSITFIIMVIIDVLIYYNVYDLAAYDKMLEIIGFTFFASIACNLLYNYISRRFGAIGNIIYRLITVLYAYIIPYNPNVYMFFRSILRMIYPYIIYQILEYTFAKSNMVIAYEDKKKNLAYKIFLGIVTIVIAMLVSCQFKYGILVVGSGSMTGALNKGDAVIYERFDKRTNLEAGQVIIFNKDDIKIVHRIAKMKKINGEVMYITKGDINPKEDDGYITNDNIEGVCKLRILYVGYPSIWIRSIFSK